MSIKSNVFLEFYGRHGISPVHQDISDFQRHVATRARLYHQLGVPTLVFRDRTVLEVGPGGGFNALATLQWGPRHYVLVEPNPQGAKELRSHFSEVPAERWTLFEQSMEAADLDGFEFDVLLCEGLLPGLDFKNEVLDAMDRVAVPGSVMVLTCADEVSMFFENLRRLIGDVIVWTSGIRDFSDKVRLLSEAFGSHIATLPGNKRPVGDWIADMLLNPTVTREQFSIADCLDILGDRYDLHGASPAMFTDYRWYKEIGPGPDLEGNRAAREQFLSLRHNLLHYRHLSGPRSPQDNAQLASLCWDFRIAVHRYEASEEPQGRQAVLNEITEGLLPALIAHCRSDMAVSAAAIQEALDLLRKPVPEPRNASACAPEFAEAFGRGQQYVSLIKR